MGNKLSLVRKGKMNILFFCYRGNHTKEIEIHFNLPLVWVCFLDPVLNYLGISYKCLTLLRVKYNSEKIFTNILDRKKLQYRRVNYKGSSQDIKIALTYIFINPLISSLSHQTLIEQLLYARYIYTLLKIPFRGNQSNKRGRSMFE